MSEKHYVVYDSSYLVTEDGSVNGKPLADGEDCVSAVGAAKHSFCRLFFETNTFRHVVVLSGAGTSMGIVLKKGGMGRVELWRECQESINAICDQLPNRSQSCLAAESKCDIEGFLSYVERCVSVMPQQKTLSESVEKLKKRLFYKIGHGHDGPSCWIAA